MKACRGSALANRLGQRVRWHCRVQSSAHDTQPLRRAARRPSSHEVRPQAVGVTPAPTSRRSDAAPATANPASPAASPAAHTQVDGPPSNFAWWTSDTDRRRGDQDQRAERERPHRLGTPLAGGERRPQRERQEDRGVGARQHRRQRPRPHAARPVSGASASTSADSREYDRLGDEHRASSGAGLGCAGRARCSPTQDRHPDDRLDHVGDAPTGTGRRRRCRSTSTRSSRPAAAPSRRRSRPGRCGCPPPDARRQRRSARPPRPGRRRRRTGC